jgi:hypothetical protein
MGVVVAWLLWQQGHGEVSFADGLRYIRQAEGYNKGVGLQSVVRAVDHPMHPLGIVAAHKILTGGKGAESWQRAAQALSLVTLALLIIPIYLLSMEIVGQRDAWIGCALVFANPLIAYIHVNVLSESTFLLFWHWGVWAAVRFLRNGTFGWVVLAVGSAVLAYLTRPEGLLLPASLVVALLLLPFLRSTRLNWKRWCVTMAFLVILPAVTVAPFVLAKGGLGTKPAIARVLGLSARPAPGSLELEQEATVDRSEFDLYAVAARRAFKALRAAVSVILLPLGLLGLLWLGPSPAMRRAGLFFAVLIVLSMFALVRLYSQAGYCTSRHALVPAIVMILLAARGLTQLISVVAIPGRWLGLPDATLQIRPAVLCAVLLCWIGWAVFPSLSAPKLAFAPYREAGQWLASHAANDGKVLDMTNWSIYFSEKSGYAFAQIYDAARDPEIRWVVARAPHMSDSWTFGSTVRSLIGDRKPVAAFPPTSRSREVQILIYDRGEIAKIATQPGASIR